MMGEWQREAMVTVQAGSTADWKKRGAERLAACEDSHREHLSRIKSRQDSGPDLRQWWLKPPPSYTPTPPLVACYAAIFRLRSYTAMKYSRKDRSCRDPP
ncbi:unnamed protein product [Arctogadus glacialis]